MNKYCVGDRVRILRSCYGADNLQVGMVADVSRVRDECGILLKGTYEEGDPQLLYFSSLEVEPYTPSRFEIGKTYKTAQHGEVICVYIHPNGQALCLFDRHHDKLNTAYVWNADGTYDSALPSSAGPYRIVFEPIIETVSEDVEIAGQDVTIEYTVTDGVADMGTVKVR